jgi:serine/threonine protein kinase
MEESSSLSIPEVAPPAAPRRKRPNNKQRRREKKKREQTQREEAESKHLSYKSNPPHQKKRRESFPVWSRVTDDQILHSELKSSKLSLNCFKELTPLGGQDMSKVKLAIHIDTLKFVALKRLEKKKYEEKKMVHHAVEEKKMLREIQSPFKVQLLGRFQTRDHVYLVTEYVEGDDLLRLIQRNDGLNEDTSRFYAAQLVLFLETLHATDGIFRDIKPENILVSHWDRYIKVVDFGFCTYLDPERGRRASVCGTVAYMCPEKLQAAAYNTASDIWSFGVLLFVMLCNRFPDNFKESIDVILKKKDEKSAWQRMRNLRRDIPKLLQQYFKDRKQRYPLSQDIQDLVASMLHFDPDRRPSISQIKHHAWFRDYPWEQLRAKKMEPPGLLDDSLLLPEEDRESSDPWKDW